MANSVIPVAYERELMHFCSIINKLKRRLILTDVMAAASTSASDLVARLYAALRSGTIELFKPEDLKLVERFEQRALFMAKLGKWTDVVVAAFTTVNTASAATDVRYSVSSLITETGFDATSEAYPDTDGVSSFAATR